MTIIGIIVAFAFLDGAARWALIAGLAVFEAFEIAIFLRWRKRRAIIGHEAMEGTKGVVVTECRPEGQVRLRGQTWKAVCREGAAVGDEIVVTHVDGITLHVARADNKVAPAAS